MDTLLQGLRAAAEPTRLRLLAICGHVELTVSDLTHILGQSQPRVSRHLKLLCDAHLLERHQEGTWAFYRLNEEGAGAALARTLVDLIPDFDATLTRDLARVDEVIEARAAAAASYFSRIAPVWNEVRSMHVPEAQVENLLLSMTDDLEINDHLDIGTGAGRMLEIFADRSNRAVGIDLSRDMLSVARAGLEKSRRRHCQVRLGDMYNLATNANSYDLVTIHMVLHYADRPTTVISEAARMLRPGGRLLIVDFAHHNHENLRQEHLHHWLGFEETDIASWGLAAGLEPLQTQVLPGDPLTVLIWDLRRPVEREAVVERGEAENFE